LVLVDEAETVLLVALGVRIPHLAGDGHGLHAPDRPLGLDTEVTVPGHPQPPAELPQTEAHPALVSRRPLAEQPRVDIHLQAAELAQREGPGDLADDVSDGDTADVGPPLPLQRENGLAAQVVLDARPIVALVIAWRPDHLHCNDGRSVVLRRLRQALDDGKFDLGSGLAAMPADGLDDGRQIPLLDPVTGNLGADPDDVPLFVGLDERSASEPSGPARLRKGRLQVLEAYPPEPVPAQLIESDDGTDARASLHGGGPRVHARLVDHGSSNVAMLLLSRSTRTVVRRAGRVNRAGRGTSTVTLPPL
jgi:hypothetical protein